MSPVIMPPGGPDENEPTRGLRRKSAPEYVPIELESSEGKFAVSLHKEHTLFINEENALNTKTAVSRIKTNLVSGFDPTTGNHAIGVYDFDIALYLINNFHDVINSFNDNEKKIIIIDLKNSFSMLVHDDPQDSTPTDSLNFRFYLICKIFATKDKLNSESALSLEHENLLDDLVSLIICGSTDLTALVPRQALEKLALENKTIPKNIKSLLCKTFLQSQWEALFERGKDLTDELRTKIGLAVDETENNEDPSEFVLKALHNQRDLCTQLLMTRNAITPDSADKKHIWDFPLETIRSSIKGKQVVLFHPSDYTNDENSSNEKLPRNLVFQLELIKLASQEGFKNWMLNLSGLNVDLLYKILRTKDENITENSLIDSLKDYLSLLRTSNVPPIRDFLFPGNTNLWRDAPLEVDHLLRFWEELLKIKNDSGAKINLNNTFYEVEPIDNLSFDGMPSLVVGQERIYKLPSSLPLSENKLISVDQFNGIKDYPLDDFRIWSGMGYSAQSLADSTSWGECDSVGIPIRENKKLEELIVFLENKHIEKSEREGLGRPSKFLYSEYRGHLEVRFKIPNADLINRMFDFVVVTKAGTDEEAEEILDPNLTDSRSPVGSPLVFA